MDQQQPCYTNTSVNRAKEHFAYNALSPQVNETRAIYINQERCYHHWIRFDIADPTFRSAVHFVLQLYSEPVFCEQNVIGTVLLAKKKALMSVRGDTLALVTLLE